MVKLSCKQKAILVAIGSVLSVALGLTLLMTFLFWLDKAFGNGAALAVILGSAAIALGWVSYSIYLDNCCKQVSDNENKGE